MTLTNHSSPGVRLGVVWRAEVVSHLVRHGDVGDGGRDGLAVVEQRDDPRVRALQAAAVMLKGRNGNNMFRVDPTPYESYIQ